MDLVFADHRSGKGIYAVSKKANPWKLKALAAEMIAWLDQKQGHFLGNFKRAYAISHCQIAHEPYAFFVLADQFVTKNPERSNTRRNFYFPARAIFNARILKAEDTITRVVPVRKLTADGKSMTVVPEKQEIDNVVPMQEGCISFPHRGSRNVKRHHRIKVRYWYLWHGIPLRRTEWVEGLKSHIFQHEIEHAQGKNMHFK